MDEGDFPFWNACRDQLPADVLINGKALASRRGEVRKDELGQLAAFALPPDAQDVFHALVDLAALVVWQERIEDALVQPQLPAVRGDLEHVVLLGVDHPGMHFRRPLG